MLTSHYQTKHDRGQKEFSSLLNYWLRGSNLTLRQFCNVCHWAVGESGCISSGPLSRLVNGEVQKISLRKLDLFSITNKAIWTFKEYGIQEVIKDIGPFHPWDVKHQWLDGAIWLPSPHDKTLPLSLGDLAEVVCGDLSLPYLIIDREEGGISPQAISSLLNQLILEMGASPKEGLTRMIMAFPGLRSPSQADNCRDLLSKLILGSGYNVNLLKKELPNIASMVSTLRGRPNGEYGVENLLEELRSLGQERQCP